ncbi:MAG: exosortase F system-associated protein [Flavobacteriales bacterium]|nr:exosortase F system-associated protein [Flavobacteriia bacterium]NCP05648.1 exosortase F system-associated protein [Flavobacteriales bacterium]PIV93088.1 MAG: exosortase F system-associated protein [Flavobacteriaceae bacterium CG17_big_fil_post_rev_8_21_14_2_50_33_15]PIY11893.1 MAG: exosortase F system-associated protein [Flavobacteriaceae bacterium CG_4_10_14_3_um_filter_33_47]PJB18311.1 MAG: exosortase F system-associated protein [Flavobacteriaceae bacterium CG_4_9_14_3_um_filter_33_16]
MNNSLKYTLLILLFGMLVLIRVFENQLFYDPYLLFFQNDYLYIDNPRREVFKLMTFTSLRYGLNAIISLAILYVVFKDVSMIKFSTLIYLFSFILLSLMYLYFVVNPKQEQYYLFFNIRRFLIQPILLLVLLPAFYYYKLKH